MKIDLYAELKTGISRIFFPVCLMIVSAFPVGNVYAQPPVVRIYLPNTADEDWSFLSEHSRRNDFWDPLKYISLGRPLVESTKTAPGCVGCELHRDALEDGVLVFHERWSDEEGLRRHLRSEQYRDLLLVMEMARKVPEVRLDEISHTSGLETIERARTGITDLC